MELCRRYADAKVWRGSVANARSARAGDKVVYHGVSTCHIRNCSDPRRILRIDSTYEVAYALVRPEGHRIKLRGIDGLFPAQGFHAAASQGWVEEP